LSWGNKKAIGQDTNMYPAWLQHFEENVANKDNLLNKVCHTGIARRFVYKV
jgi:hypothetical protein